MPRRRDQQLLDDIGARIGRLRRARGLSQEALAARVGIQAESVSRCETGATALSLTNLVRIADALSVSLGDLVDRARVEPAPPGREDARELLALFETFDAGARDLALRLLRDVAATWPVKALDGAGTGESG